MWEILYGRSVTFEHSSELQFQLQVCKGYRPHIYENTAICYSDLMKKCWHMEPEKRPTAKEIYDIFVEWHNNENILSELSESDKKLQNITNIYIESHHKSSIISLNNSYKYQGSKLYEMKIPDIID
ncbi:hypothetical protein C2G38_2312530 [Gigaspora rosea]|uniref:Serine-threonine/tyrosine-protein kinase catalytic domain-containing protein n=1 Tax=Gigaspora rosea TaxID=44941 RepID=A0A397V6Q9_9GLOM|nr:hypothetical protein C2G38_2312530 [Gigaspora rosea]